MENKTMKWDVAHTVRKAYDEYFQNHFEGTDDWFYEVVAGFCKGLTLDAGCGNSCDILSRVDDSLGCDLSQVAVKQSMKRGYNAVQCMGEYLPFKNNAFDSVTSLGCLEHYTKVNVGLAEMVRVLKPEGRMVLQAERAPSSYQIHLHLLWKLLATFFLKRTFNRHLLTKKTLLSMFNHYGLRTILVGEQGMQDYSEVLFKGRKGRPFYSFVKRLPESLRCHPYHVVLFAFKQEVKS